MRPLPLLVVASLALLVPAVSGAKILCLFGFSGKSHTHVFGALTSELARRGHDITVITAFPLKDPPGKFRQIDVPAVRSLLQSFDQMSHTQLNIFQKMNFFLDMAGGICPSILSMPEVTKLRDEKFDLVIASMFFNDCCLPFARHNKAPLILISPVGLISWVGASIGHPESLATVPSLFLPLSDRMSFPERALNAVLYYSTLVLRRVLLLPRMNAAAREFFGEDTPLVTELEANASLALLNNHVSLNYPRPFLPNVIEVGGMHVEQATKPLPKDLQEFLDGAKEGVIYFSMGSVVRPEDFPAEMVEALVRTFSELPQRVLWKWNLDTLPGQPKNVKLGKWLPQQDILAHPNVRLFITHGGLLSTQEASYHGVPLVGIPVLGDQELNVKRSELLGFAVGVDFKTLSKETLLPAIKTVLTDPSYKQKAQILMERVRDQPQTPLDRAVFWTEYVIRHKGAPHLRSAALDLAWYQLYLLDVAAAILVTLLLTVLVMKRVIRACCGGKKALKPPKGRPSGQKDLLKPKRA